MSQLTLQVGFFKPCAPGLPIRVITEQVAFGNDRWCTCMPFWNVIDKKRSNSWAQLKNWCVPRTSVDLPATECTQLWVAFTISHVNQWASWHNSRVCRILFPRIESRYDIEWWLVFWSEENVEQFHKSDGYLLHRLRSSSQFTSCSSLFRTFNYPRHECRTHIWLFCIFRSAPF